MFQTKESAIKKASLKKGAAAVQATTWAAKPTPPGKTAASGAVTPEERNRMIAEAAYYIAEQRSFAGGSPLEDWSAAEAQIDAMLSRRRA
jgi:hypothetical protein